MSKQNIEYIKTESLIPYVNNSRTHSEEQIDQIAASIKEFGFTNPILIDTENGLIAGHGRILASRKLELAEVPCIRLDGLTEAQKKAYIIADNKLALNAGWDDEMLKLEMETLNEMGYELNVLGFSADEINLIFDGWSSDIELDDKVDDSDQEMIRVKVSKDNHAFAEQTITNALESAGIEYEL